MIPLTEGYTPTRTEGGYPFEGIMIVDFVQNPLISGAVGKVLRSCLPSSIGDTTSKSRESPSTMVEAIRGDVAFNAGIFQAIRCTLLDFGPVRILWLACKYGDYTPVDVNNWYGNSALPGYTAIIKIKR
jgi:hypothetical protein